LSGNATTQELIDEQSPSQWIRMSWRRTCVKLVRVDQPPSCSFCGKSRQDAKTLIASPGHLAHICDECTLGPSTLKTGLDEPGIEQTVSASVFERVVRFFRHSCDGPSSKRLRCSFCRRKANSGTLYVPSPERGAHKQICKGCLIVCHQILTDDTNLWRPETSRRRFKSEQTSAAYSANCCAFLTANRVLTNRVDR
jgi:hypothetical protein